MTPHRFTSQALTDPRIHWGTASQVHLTGHHRAQPVRYVSPVGGYLTGATSQELTTVVGASRPDTLNESRAV